MEDKVILTKKELEQLIDDSVEKAVNSVLEKIEEIFAKYSTDTIQNKDDDSDTLLEALGELNNDYEFDEPDIIEKLNELKESNKKLKIGDVEKWMESNGVTSFTKRKLNFYCKKEKELVPRIATEFDNQSYYDYQSIGYYLLVDALAEYLSVATIEDILKVLKPAINHHSIIEVYRDFCISAGWVKAFVDKFYTQTSELRSSNIERALESPIMREYYEKYLSFLLSLSAPSGINEDIENLKQYELTEEKGEELDEAIKLSKQNQSEYIKAINKSKYKQEIEFIKKRIVNEAVAEKIEEYCSTHMDCNYGHLYKLIDAINLPENKKKELKEYRNRASEYYDNFDFQEILKNSNVSLKDLSEKTIEYVNNMNNAILDENFKLKRGD